MVETEVVGLGRRTKEWSWGGFGRYMALEALSVDRRVVWGKGSPTAFREMGHPTDQASPRVVRGHILSRCVAQGSDRLARQANPRRHCFAASARVKLLPPLESPYHSPPSIRAAAFRHSFFEVSGLSRPILLLRRLPGGPQQPPNRELRLPVSA